MTFREKFIQLKVDIIKIILSSIRYFQNQLKMNVKNFTLSTKVLIGFFLIIQFTQVQAALVILGFGIRGFDGRKNRK